MFMNKIKILFFDYVTVKIVISEFGYTFQTELNIQFESLFIILCIYYKRYSEICTYTRVSLSLYPSLSLFII